MSWHEIKITTEKKYLPQLEEKLQGFGAEALTLLNDKSAEIYEPELKVSSCWDSIHLIALFDHEIDLTPVQDFLSQQKSHISNYQINFLPDEDWQRRSLQDFKPMHFGNNLWVYPSWEKPQHPNAIILDPGLAFGTGTHATTSLCLQWLAENIAGNEIVIDYGCGSGILGIAALKLGAQKVFAIDHDDIALTVANENAERNAVKHQFHTAFPDKSFKVQADILIANILAQPLINLAEYFASLMKHKSKIVLSGILQEQFELIKAAYSNYCDLKIFAEKDNWLCLTSKIN